MNAVSMIEAETLEDEIASASLGDSTVAARRQRWVAARWFNDLPLARKLGVLVGGLLLGLAVNSVVALAALRQIVAPSVAVSVVTVIFVLGFGLGTIALRRILIDTAMPLRKLSGDMIRLSEGDRTFTLDYLHRADEIGDMASAVNRFVDKLQPIVREAGEVAQRTGVEIGAMAQRNAGADAAAALQRDEVAASLRDLSSMADEAQAESHAMQAALQQVVDIRQATDENSRSSTQLASLIENLAGQVETGSQVIERLAKQSEQIEVVLTVIHGIAEQTNLLALNAAIEAARAGETGRGFAVVADEVRALASKTQSSTGDIQAHIAALQKGAKEAVATISQAGLKASEGLLVLRDNERRQQSVQAAVEQVHAAIGLATRAAEQQASGAQAVRGRVETIHAQAERSAEVVMQTTASSKVLDDLAAQLRASLGQFRA